MAKLIGSITQEVHTFKGYWEINNFDDAMSCQKFVELPRVSLPDVNGEFVIKLKPIRAQENFGLYDKNSNYLKGRILQYFGISLESASVQKIEKFSASVKLMAGNDVVAEGHLGRYMGEYVKAPWQFKSNWKEKEKYPNCEVKSYDSSHSTFVYRESTDECNFFTLTKIKKLIVDIHLQYPVNLVKTEYSNEDCKETIRDVYKNLLTDVKHSDFVIRCKNRTFQCHKLILSSRSPVLDRMIDDDFQEMKRGDVVIKDLEPEVLEILLEYIYTGSVAHMGNDLYPLLYAADKYQLPGLIDLCVREYEVKVTADTAVDTILVAERHSQTKLKRAVLSQIVKNKSSFLANPEFTRKLKENSHLMLEILSV